MASPLPVLGRCYKAPVFPLAWMGLCELKQMQAKHLVSDIFKKLNWIVSAATT